MPARSTVTCPAVEGPVPARSTVTSARGPSACALDSDVPGGRGPSGCALDGGLQVSPICRQGLQRAMVEKRRPLAPSSDCWNRGILDVCCLKGCE